MKSFVIFCGLFVICASSALRKNIPNVPRDNSHYVEGESRYVWMPDGDGIPHLVDLHEPVNEALLNSRNGANNEYWLFTRDNPTTQQIITHENAASISNSNYDGSRPLKVIVHGWNNNGDSDMNPMITEAFLTVQDANVIVVDWKALASSNYYTASRGVPSVGEYLGNFLVWLINTAGGDWNQVHLVGFSLGAHVVGNAGRTVNGLARRVTGLDPAGPLWGGNADALNTNSGQYVETINTDGGILGIFDPIGHTNFYPNGGRNPQAGCLTSLCSHGRSTELFAASVLYNHFVGKLCNNVYEAELSSCTGATLNMGNAIISKTGTGLYGLLTGRTWPF